jgi:hypothetical protein
LLKATDAKPDGASPFQGPDCRKNAAKPYGNQIAVRPPPGPTPGSYAYAHGGISLQECLTTVLVVSGGASSAPAAAITEISWKGLRCNVEVSGDTAGMQADLRRDAGARLLVEDDELEGVRVVAVLLSPDGRVIAQRRTRVGGDQ